MPPDRACGIGDCTRIVDKRGLCHLHYQQVRTAGLEYMPASMYDAVTRLVDLRLVLAQVHARVTQAQIVLTSDPSYRFEFPLQLDEIIADAELILRSALVGDRPARVAVPRAAGAA